MTLKLESVVLVCCQILNVKLLDNRTRNVSACNLYIQRSQKRMRIPHYAENLMWRGGIGKGLADVQNFGLFV